MKAELKELIEERKKEALEKKFFEKGQTTAQYLGSCKEQDYKTWWSDKVHMFTHDEYEITVKHTVNDFPNDRKDQVEILARTDEGEFETVYEGHKEKRQDLVGERMQIIGYIPGKWQEKFELVYTRAKEIEEKVLKQELEETKLNEAKKEMDMLRRFGLLGYLKDDLKEI